MMWDERMKVSWTYRGPCSWYNKGLDHFKADPSFKVTFRLTGQADPDFKFGYDKLLFRALGPLANGMPLIVSMLY